MVKGHIGELVELGYEVSAVNKTKTAEREPPEAGLSQGATEIMNVFIYLFFTSALSLENKLHSGFIMDGKILANPPITFFFLAQFKKRFTQK